MQFISLATGLSAALLATAVTAEQATEYNLNVTGVSVSNKATIVNNCPYDVYLWSILKGHGCPSEGAVRLSAGGGLYHEEFRKDEDGKSVKTGVSIKISKTKQCKGVDITQLEYFEERDNPAMPFNFLDVSYVDCLGGDCPARKDGYYLKAGNANKVTKADASMPRCPTFQCTDQASCDKTSYVLPDDEQTKSCALDEPLEFYMCGKQPQQGGEEEEEKPSPSSSQKEVESSSETPTPSSAAVKENFAAAITPPAQAPKEETPKTKTQVVYVTQYKYVDAKRHAHNHVHRHFRA